MSTFCVLIVRAGEMGGQLPLAGLGPDAFHQAGQLGHLHSFRANSYHGNVIVDT